MEAEMGEMITIPLDEYKRMQAAVEDLADLQTHDRVMTDLATGREERVPAAYVRRLIAGESPLRIWRDLRGLTQSALAQASGVNRVQIAEIEAGRKNGSLETARRLAEALGISVDDLV
jgi:DNA-binding XRE family transcriptional regulator